MKTRNLFGLLFSLAVLVITGCGGGGGGGGGGGTVNPPVAPTVSVAISKAVAANTGVDSVTVSATVKLSGVAVSGTAVTFAVKSGLGTLSQTSAVTDVNGVASVGLTSITDGDIDIVTAASGGVSADSGSITFLNSNNPVLVNEPVAVVLAASPGSGTTQANGGVTLTATVSPRGPGGTIANQTPVTFTITSGTGTISAVTTTSGGVATAILTAATANTVTVTAKVGNVTSASVSVNFAGQPTLAVVKLSTTGTLPAGVTIGGIQAVISYAPTGPFTLNNSDVVASGVSLTAPASPLITPNATSGTVILGVLDVFKDPITQLGVGLQKGEFATLNFHVAPGTFSVPTVIVTPGPLVFNTNNVPISGSVVFDTNNVAIPGMTVTVSPGVLQ